MIGFKLLDEFTFDDCVKSIERRKSEGLTLDEDLLQRYNTLLETLKTEEKRDYQSVKTIDELERYIKKYSALPGATKYQSEYLDKAKQEFPRLKQVLDRRKKTMRYCFIIGIVVGLISMRYLPYLVASSISSIYVELGDSADWGVVGFPFIFASLTIILSYVFWKKKTIKILKFVFFFLGITLACIPMGFYAYSNDVAFDVFIPNYGIANAFGLYYGDRGDGLTDFLGNEIVPREYNCFFFTSNRIIGIKQDNHNLVVHEYDYNGRKESDELELEICDSTNSIKLIDVLIEKFGLLSQYCRYNSLKGIMRYGEELHARPERYSCMWRGEEIFDMPVIIK